MDPFKKYLQQHRDELDSEEPGDAVWQKIREQAAPARPPKSLVKKLWPYAAAACLVLCLITGILLLQKPQPATAYPTASRPEKPAGPGSAKVRPSPADTQQTGTKTDRPESYATIHPHKKKGTWRKHNRDADPAMLLVKAVEQNYAQLLNNELQRVRTTPVYAESPDYFSAFRQQYRQIASDEALIRNDIQQQGLNDKLLQQLININQQKLNVLKDLQAEIQKLNRKTQARQAFQADSRGFYLTI